MSVHLNLNQLKAFYFAAKYGSMTRAAKQLFVTQPAVSMQIRALENQYDVLLFTKRNKKFELTDCGKRLYDLAEKIFALIEEAERLLGKPQDFPTEILKIGSTKTLLRYLLPPHISRFQETFPRIQIQLNEGNSEEMVQSVLENRNDLAIVGRVPYAENVKAIPFIQDELLLLAPPNHRLSGQGPVPMEDLRGETLILREKGSGTRRLIQSVMEERGIFPRVVIEAGNVDFIKELVKDGRGITVLATMGVREEVKAGLLRSLPLREGPLILDIDIVVRKGRKLSLAAKSFLDLLLESVKGSAVSQASSAGH